MPRPSSRLSSLADSDTVTVTVTVTATVTDTVTVTVTVTATVTVTVTVTDTVTVIAPFPGSRHAAPLRSLPSSPACLPAGRSRLAID